MLQIAVCDDERAAADLIAGLARDWARGRGVEARVDTFASADALFFSLDDGAPDVALLDIEKPGASGMERARLLRVGGERTQVVFVTGIIDHVFDGYDVDAVSYLLKPVRADGLFSALDRARERLGRAEPVLVVESAGETSRVAVSRVCYVEGSGHDALVLAMRRRGTLSRRDVALLACVMAALGTLAAAGPPASAALALLAAFGSYALVTGGYARLRRGFESSAERFQQEVLSRQYDEIRAIYLDTRGWRHDYHNHLQVMKAELAAAQLAELSAYLDELEADLDRVDTYVKSGNLMVDAILNSKLSLAERDGVAVTCKARVPDALTVDDVDLCVILGNLLDNAIEACAALPADGRWLRVYVAARGSQLYASIQNSAVEDPSFNQRNYISEKRGNHGLGMKRVAAVVEKYEGFLNLANEPGVFAAEVSLPL